MDGGQRPERLDDLRRRLYRAGATQADIDRYLVERDAGAEPTGAAAQDPVRGGPRPRARTVGVVLTAVVASIALVPALLHQSTADSGRSVDVGEGRRITVLAGAVSSAEAVETAVRGTPVIGQRFEGRGGALVHLSTVASPVRGGRMVIALATSGSAPIEWRALLVVPRTRGPDTVFVMARGAADRPDHPVTSIPFVYADRPPADVAVEAPPGVRWALVVAVSNGLVPASQ